MRIHVAIALLLIVNSNVALAKKIKGTIITGNETREVTFNVRIPWLAGEPSFEGLQYRVKYFDETGKKHILKPDEATEIRFEHNGQLVRMISCKNNLDLGNMFTRGSHLFLKLEIDGPLKLLRYYYKQTHGGMMTAGGGYSPGYSYTADNLLFMKSDGRLKQPRALGWKKDMTEYFSDCPQLVNLIQGKDLRRREMEAIVMFYNKNCGR